MNLFALPPFDAIGLSDRVYMEGIMIHVNVFRDRKLVPDQTISILVPYIIESVITALFVQGDCDSLENSSKVPRVLVQDSEQTAMKCPALAVLIEAKSSRGRSTNLAQRVALVAEALNEAINVESARGNIQRLDVDSSEIMPNYVQIRLVDALEEAYF